MPKMKNFKFFLTITIAIIIIYLVVSALICTLWLGKIRKYQKEVCLVTECNILRTNCKKNTYCYDIILKFSLLNSITINLFHFNDINLANNFCSEHYIGSEITCYCVKNPINCVPDDIDNTLTSYNGDNYSLGIMVLIFFSILLFFIIISIYGLIAIK